MTPDQIPQLIKQVSYADPRLLPEDPAELMGLAALWAIVLADVPAEYAMTAVGEHYAQSPYPIKPSDIADRWRTTVRNRMRADNETEAPAADPDQPTAYIAALRYSRTRVAQGSVPPRAIPARADHEDVAAMHQQGDLREFIRQGMQAAAAENKRRRLLLRRHPDLAERLTVAPCPHTSPEKWSGYVAPDTWNGSHNDSPIRAAIAELVAEAERREAAGHNHQTEEVA